MKSGAYDYLTKPVDLPHRDQLVGEVVPARIDRHARHAARRPFGTAEPAQPSAGIVHVLVNGAFVVRNEKLVDGTAPGQPVRRAVTRP